MRTLVRWLIGLFASPAAGSIPPRTMEEVEAAVRAVHGTFDGVLTAMLRKIAEAVELRLLSTELGARSTVAKAGADDAAAIADTYRKRLADYPELLDRPYAGSVHFLFMIGLILVETTSAIAAFDGVSGVGVIEARALPAGLVGGLIVAAHVLGALLKGLHTAHAVRQYPEDVRRRIPPAEFFGTSPWWLTMTALASMALVVAPIAMYGLRDGALASSIIDLEAGRATGPVLEPLPFALITFVIGIAATAESFLWTNPWIETLTEHERVSKRMEEAAVRAEQRAAEAASRLAVNETAVSASPARTLERIELEIELADAHAQVSGQAGRADDATAWGTQAALLRRQRERSQEVLGAVQSDPRAG